MLSSRTAQRRLILTIALLVLALLLCATTTQAQTAPEPGAASSGLTNGLTFGLERVPALNIQVIH